MRFVRLTTSPIRLLLTFSAVAYITAMVTGCASAPADAFVEEAVADLLTFPSTLGMES